jgi:hypothetical protein
MNINCRSRRRATVQKPSCSEGNSFRTVHSRTAPSFWRGDELQWVSESIAIVWHVTKPRKSDIANYLQHNLLMTAFVTLIALASSHIHVTANLAAIPVIFNSCRSRAHIKHDRTFMSGPIVRIQDRDPSHKWARASVVSVRSFLEFKRGVRMASIGLSSDGCWPPVHSHDMKESIMLCYIKIFRRQTYKEV